jgi:hypothetical protein
MGKLNDDGFRAACRADMDLQATRAGACAPTRDLLFHYVNKVYVLTN